MFYTNDTMKCVNAGIAGLNGLVDIRSLEITPEFIVTDVEWNDLLECKLVFYYDDASVVLVVCIFIDVTLLVNVGHLGFADTDAEFFLASKKKKNK